MAEITLLVLVGLSALQPFNGALFGTNTNEWLIRLSSNIGAATFLLLILMNLLLIFLYIRPEADILWWLNLVAMIALAFGVLSGFSPGHVLIALSIGLGLAYRRIQGLKHIWHWRGLLLVTLGLVAGILIAVYGLGAEGVIPVGPS